VWLEDAIEEYIYRILKVKSLESVDLGDQKDDRITQLRIILWK